MNSQPLKSTNAKLSSIDDAVVIPTSQPNIPLATCGPGAIYTVIMYFGLT